MHRRMMGRRWGGCMLLCCLMLQAVCEIHGLVSRRHPTVSHLSAQSTQRYSYVCEDGPLELAHDAVRVLAKSGRTWRRLRHMVELGLESDCGKDGLVADIGCDHGLLSMALAMSGSFPKGVVGVDKSLLALEMGALSLFHQVKSQDFYQDISAFLTPVMEETSVDHLQLSFRHGDGLKVFEDDEKVPLVCVSGIGVNTMLGILDQDELDRVGCRDLIVQPINTRPRIMLRLYDALQETGWSLTGERIAHVSGRWFLSGRFVRKARGESSHAENAMPGQLLSPTDTTYRSFVDYHKAWSEQDSSKQGRMRDDDTRWINFVTHQLKH